MKRKFWHFVDAKHCCWGFPRRSCPRNARPSNASINTKRWLWLCSEIKIRLDVTLNERTCWREQVNFVKKLVTKLWEWFLRGWFSRAMWRARTYYSWLRVISSIPVKFEVSFDVLDTFVTVFFERPNLILMKLVQLLNLERDPTTLVDCQNQRSKPKTRRTFKKPHIKN